MAIDFEASRVRVASAAVENRQTGKTSAETKPRWSIDLQLTRYGYDAQLRPVPDVRQRVVNGNRIEYRSGEERRGKPALTEWYVNGPLGLKQGFTLTERPGARGSGRHTGGEELVLEMAVSGSSGSGAEQPSAVASRTVTNPTPGCDRPCMPSPRCEGAAYHRGDGLWEGKGGASRLLRGSLRLR